MAGIAGLAVILTNMIDFEADDLRVRVLNANLDSSWSHRATAGILAAGAVIALRTAWRTVRGRMLWGATAAMMILLFVVEISPLHVQVDRLSYGKLIYLPLLVGLVGCVCGLSAGSPLVALVRAGLAALVVSYGVHLFGAHVVNALGWGAGTWVYQLKVGVKEGTELGGWLLLVLALWRLAQARPRRGTRLDDRVGGRRKLARWAIGTPRSRG